MQINVEESRNVDVRIEEVYDWEKGKDGREIPININCGAKRPPSNTRLPSRSIIGNIICRLHLST